jgi:hypothetical protein
MHFFTIGLGRLLDSQELDYGFSDSGFKYGLFHRAAVYVFWRHKDVTELFRNKVKQASSSICNE